MRVAATPPRTPPAIAPVFEEEPLGSGDGSDDDDDGTVEVGVLEGVEEAAEKDGKMVLVVLARYPVNKGVELTFAGGNDG